MKENKKLIIECACSGEMMVVREDQICDEDGTLRIREFSVGLYSSGTYRSKPGFWWRLKYAWNHLKTGIIYEDYLIMNAKEAKKLEEWLRETNLDDVTPLT